jgi:hypothetical protein
VNVDEVARPFTSVVSVSVVVAFANKPLAPDDGAVNVTDTPLVGVPPVVTCATSGAANAVLPAVLWLFPLCNVIVSTGGLELELLQPVRKTKARKTKARMLT